MVHLQLLLSAAVAATLGGTATAGTTGGQWSFNIPPQDARMKGRWFSCPARTQAVASPQSRASADAAQLALHHVMPGRTLGLPVYDPMQEESLRSYMYPSMDEVCDQDCAVEKEVDAQCASESFAARRRHHCLCAHSRRFVPRPQVWVACRCLTLSHLHPAASVRPLGCVCVCVATQPLKCLFATPQSQPQTLSSAQPTPTTQSMCSSSACAPSGQ